MLTLPGPRLCREKGAERGLYIYGSMQMGFHVTGHWMDRLGWNGSLAARATHVFESWFESSLTL